MWSDLAIF